MSSIQPFDRPDWYRAGYPRTHLSLPASMKSGLHLARRSSPHPERGKVTLRDNTTFGVPGHGVRSALDRRATGLFARLRYPPGNAGFEVVV